MPHGSADNQSLPHNSENVPSLFCRSLLQRISLDSDVLFVGMTEIKLRIIENKDSSPLCEELILTENVSRKGKKVCFQKLRGRPDKISGREQSA
jgi:hypothetical protein